MPTTRTHGTIKTQKPVQNFGKAFMVIQSCQIFQEIPIFLGTATDCPFIHPRPSAVLRLKPVSVSAHCSLATNSGWSLGQGSIIVCWFPTKAASSVHHRSLCWVSDEVFFYFWAESLNQLAFVGRWRTQIKDVSADPLTQVCCIWFCWQIRHTTLWEGSTPQFQVCNMRLLIVV